jgi:hypothetical protein
MTKVKYFATSNEFSSHPSSRFLAFSNDHHHHHHNLDVGEKGLGVKMSFKTISNDTW